MRLCDCVPLVCVYLRTQSAAAAANEELCVREARNYVTVIKGKSRSKEELVAKINQKTKPASFPSANTNPAAAECAPMAATSLSSSAHETASGGGSGSAGPSQAKGTANDDRAIKEWWRQMRPKVPTIVKQIKESKKYEQLVNLALVLEELLKVPETEDLSQDMVAHLKQFRDELKKMHAAKGTASTIQAPSSSSSSSSHASSESADSTSTSGGDGAEAVPVSDPTEMTDADDMKTEAPETRTHSADAIGALWDTLRSAHNITEDAAGRTLLPFACCLFNLAALLVHHRCSFRGFDSGKGCPGRGSNSRGRHVLEDGTSYPGNFGAIGWRKYKQVRGARYVESRCRRVAKVQYWSTSSTPRRKTGENDGNA
jgi:hypothetical protein